MPVQFAGADPSCRGRQRRFVVGSAVPQEVNRDAVKELPASSGGSPLVSSRAFVVAFYRRIAAPLWYIGFGWVSSTSPRNRLTAASVHPCLPFISVTVIISGIFILQRTPLYLCAARCRRGVTGPAGCGGSADHP